MWALPAEGGAMSVNTYCQVVSRVAYVFFVLYNDINGTTNFTKTLGKLSK
jgi:hypothetical protein